MNRSEAPPRRSGVVLALLVSCATLAPETAHADIIVPRKPIRLRKVKKPAKKRPVRMYTRLRLVGQFKGAHGVKVPRSVVRALARKEARRLRRAARRAKRGVIVPFIARWWRPTITGLALGLGALGLWWSLVALVGRRWPRRRRRAWGRGWLAPAAVCAAVALTATIWSARVRADASAYESIDWKQGARISLSDGDELRVRVPKKKWRRQCARYAGN